MYSLAPRGVLEKFFFLFFLIQGVQPEVCTNRGFRGGFDACRPVGTFWYFSKSDSKSGRVHAGVDVVEQARTCASSSAAMLQEFESWLYPKI